MPVVTCMISTVAFGTAPPLVSSIVPTRFASVVWPKQNGVKPAKTMAQARLSRNLLIFLLERTN
jgi:hypothetical protein